MVNPGRSSTGTKLPPYTVSCLLGHRTHSDFPSQRGSQSLGNLYTQKMVLPLATFCTSRSPVSPAAYMFFYFHRIYLVPGKVQNFPLLFHRVFVKSRSRALSFKRRNKGFARIRTSLLKIVGVGLAAVVSSCNGLWSLYIIPARRKINHLTPPDSFFPADPKKNCIHIKKATIVTQRPCFLMNTKLTSQHVCNTNQMWLRSITLLCLTLHQMRHRLRGARTMLLKQNQHFVS